MATSTDPSVLRSLRLLKRRRDAIFTELNTTAALIGNPEAQPGNSDNFLVRCTVLDGLRTEFREIQNEIMTQNEDAVVGDQLPVEERYTEFDQVFFRIKGVQASLTRIITNAAVTNNSGPSSHNSSTSHEDISSVRMPKINIPTWDGDMDTFPNFFSLFNSVVHSSNHSPAVKMTYLRGYLRGRPLKMIENLDISDQNYDVAYGKIKNTYDNVRIRATHHLKKMFDFTPLTSESATGLEQFLDVFQTNYQAFRNLNVGHHHDFIMFVWALSRLPSPLRVLFDRSLDSEEDNIPTFAQLVDFIEQQCRVKEQDAQLSSAPRIKPAPKKPLQSLIVTPTTNETDVSNEPPSSSGPKTICPLCTSGHKLHMCPVYTALSIIDKRKELQRMDRCDKCLGSHGASACLSKGRCRICRSSRHHSSLHEPSAPSTSVAQLTPLSSPVAQSTPLPSSDDSSSDLSNTSLLTKLGSPALTQTVILATAQAFIKDVHGSWCPVRIVLDPGSMVHLISSACVQRLGLKVQRHSVPIVGALHQQVGVTEGSVTCVLSSKRQSEPPLLAQALVVKRVCSELPTSSLPSDVYSRFSHLDLADRTFYMRGEVDLLLGAALFSNLFKPEYAVIQGEPAAMETIFGWVILGKSPALIPEPEVAITGLICGLTLDEAVQRFWQLEDIAPIQCSDPADALVEAHFQRTRQRLPNGRFMVRLPFDEGQPALFGKSKETAIRRWYNLESKLMNTPELQRAYHNFLSEYLTLGHMSPALEPGSYYIPHFAVLRDSPSSPVRVVFDASCKDSSGLSLNCRLHAGPPLQKDITVVVQHFRFHPFAVTADIKMMYRQIWLHPGDRRFQHIFWRKFKDQPLQEYELNTVTYGLTSAPYLAQRVLLDLAETDGRQYPLASQALKEACYMDDCCFSLPTKSEALRFRVELEELLLLAGFELRKWASNCEEVIADIPQEHRASQVALRAECSPTLHILGIQWNPARDDFTYLIDLDVQANTKRRVLSKVASIFDPLGWVAPVVFWAKVFLRELWAKQLGWDTELPPELISRWLAFAEQLPDLEKISIPRQCILPNATKVQLVGFCDASELGYAAALYLRSAVNGDVAVRLIKARTKVAPLHVQTVQRLELNGALLLAQLVDSVSFIYNSLHISDCTLFTDSATVLAWLRTPPHLLKTYIANRVVRILELTDLSSWRHVPTLFNAADCASRGLSPSALLDWSIWWHGPSFLCDSKDCWPSTSSQLPSVSAMSEMKPTPTVSLTTTVQCNSKLDKNLQQMITSFSTLSRLRRVVAWILRFVSNARTDATIRTFGNLGVMELQTALKVCLKVTQMHYFGDDLRAVSKGKVCSKPLRQLLPFIGEDGLLRVGGRLQHSLLPTEAKHPVILPKNAPLSTLIVEAFHKQLLHAGPQAVHAQVQREFWILSARSLIRQQIWKCVPCHKMRAKLNHPIMADLPASRVTPSRPFSNSSVDMAGPFNMKESTRRNSRVLKCWMAVFVCLSSKAAHLELVTSLSAEAFRGALDRFVARRGLCKRIYCDNGTNFKGVSNELREIHDSLQIVAPNLQDYLAQRDVDFIFNPPEAPWMGGLWEAAVKSAKRHIALLSTNRFLTYEEFSTLLCRIEAVMNSRPLCRILPQPPDNLDVLTPGHFLVGGPLLSPPELDIHQEPENHLSRWQSVQKATQEFWKRWSREYLLTLTTRPKWSVPRAPLNVGDPVFIISENTKPLDWPLARVEELFPGNDGIPRKARVRTNRGSYLRPIAKLVSLPPSDPPSSTL